LGVKCFNKDFWRNNGPAAPTRTIEHQLQARDERDFFLNRACAGWKA
jgi:hypothetical protein